MENLQRSLEGKPPFKRSDSYLFSKSGNKLKIRLPDRGLVTLQKQDDSLILIGKQQTKKGGFTIRLEDSVDFPQEKDSSSWYTEYHVTDLITIITDFLTKCKKNEVIRKQPTIEPDKFEDVAFLRGGKRIFHAARGHMDPLRLHFHSGFNLLHPLQRWGDLLPSEENEGWLFSDPKSPPRFTLRIHRWW
jgi:hypothetical protein